MQLICAGAVGATPTLQVERRRVSSKELLSGIRVVEVSRIIAAHGRLNSADFGADVVKVERPGSGDEARSYVRGQVDGVGISPLFLAFNSGRGASAWTCTMKRVEHYCWPLSIQPMSSSTTFALEW